MYKRVVTNAVALAISFIALATAANAACLGVSRTINVSSFKAQMGATPSGGIGLRHKEVVLTFDDGPVPGKTTRILSALAAECTKATFFAVGTMARAHPSLLRRVASAGHTIGHHTHNHSHLPSRSSAAAQSDIQRGMQSINKALGSHKRSSRLFRYPYLARSNSLDNILRVNRLLPFSAGIDSNDWKSISSASVVNGVMRQLAHTGRGVILMHDIQAKTVTALPVLLDRLKAGGYKVVHIRAGNARMPKIASLGPSKSVRKKVALRKNLDRKKTSSVSSRDRLTVKKSKSRKSLFARIFTKRKATKKAVAKKSTIKRAKRRVASVSKKQKKKLSWLAKRRKAALARSKAKSRKVTSRSTKKSTAKKRKFSLFRNAVKRKKGESMAAYHHRVKRHRKKMAKR